MPTSQLPRHCPPHELGHLQCFVDSEVIDTFVSNTNAYATSRGAIAWVPITTEEMWRHLAVRIRQGIVCLPDLHQSWEGEYRDSRVTQLSRNRFAAVHRYLHIVPPVPVGQRQTVVEKTAPFYHRCQALFQHFYVPGARLALDETMVRCQAATPG